MENPVEIHGEQSVDVGVLTYKSCSSLPSHDGYYLCRLETSFGGPYYKILMYEMEPLESSKSGIRQTHWSDGLKPAYEVTHWTRLPKIPLDAVVPAPEN